MAKNNRGKADSKKRPGFLEGLSRRRTGRRLVARLRRSRGRYDASLRSLLNDLRRKNRHDEILESLESAKSVDTANAAFYEGIIEAESLYRDLATTAEILSKGGHDPDAIALTLTERGLSRQRLLNSDPVVRQNLQDLLSFSPLASVRNLFGGSEGSFVTAESTAGEDGATIISSDRTATESGIGFRAHAVGSDDQGPAERGKATELWGKIYRSLGGARARAIFVDYVLDVERDLVDTEAFQAVLDESQGFARKLEARIGQGATVAGPDQLERLCEELGDRGMAPMVTRLSLTAAALSRLEELSTDAGETPLRRIDALRERYRKLQYGQKRESDAEKRILEFAVRELAKHPDAAKRKAVVSAVKTKVLANIEVRSHELDFRDVAPRLLRSFRTVFSLWKAAYAVAFPDASPRAAETDEVAFASSTEGGEDAGVQERNIRRLTEKAEKADALRFEALRDAGDSDVLADRAIEELSGEMPEELRQRFYRLLKLPVAFTETRPIAFGELIGRLEERAFKNKTPWEQAGIIDELVLELEKRGGNDDAIRKLLNYRGNLTRQPNLLTLVLGELRAIRVRSGRDLDACLSAQAAYLSRMMEAEEYKPIASSLLRLYRTVFAQRTANPGELAVLVDELSVEPLWKQYMIIQDLKTRITRDEFVESRIAAISEQLNYEKMGERMAKQAEASAVISREAASGASAASGSRPRGTTFGLEELKLDFDELFAEESEPLDADWELEALPESMSGVAPVNNAGTTADLASATGSFSAESAVPSHSASRSRTGDREGDLTILRKILPLSAPEALDALQTLAETSPDDPVIEALLEFVRLVISEIDVLRSDDEKLKRLREWRTGPYRSEPFLTPYLDALIGRLEEAANRNGLLGRVHSELAKKIDRQAQIEYLLDLEKDPVYFPLRGVLKHIRAAIEIEPDVIGREYLMQTLRPLDLRNEEAVRNSLLLLERWQGRYDGEAEELAPLQVERLDQAVEECRDRRGEEELRTLAEKEWQALESRGGFNMLFDSVAILEAALAEPGSGRRQRIVLEQEIAHSRLPKPQPGFLRELRMIRCLLRGESDTPDDRLKSFRSLSTLTFEEKKDLLKQLVLSRTIGLRPLDDLLGGDSGLLVEALAEQGIVVRVPEQESIEVRILPGEAARWDAVFKRAGLESRDTVEGVKAILGRTLCGLLGITGAKIAVCAVHLVLQHPDLVKKGAAQKILFLKNIFRDPGKYVAYKILFGVTDDTMRAVIAELGAGDAAPGTSKVASVPTLSSTPKSASPPAGQESVKAPSPSQALESAQAAEAIPRKTAQKDHAVSAPGPASTGTARKTDAEATPASEAKTPGIALSLSEAETAGPTLAAKSASAEKARPAEEEPKAPQPRSESLKRAVEKEALERLAEEASTLRREILEKLRLVARKAVDESLEDVNDLLRRILPGLKDCRPGELPRIIKESMVPVYQERIATAANEKEARLFSDAVSILNALSLNLFEPSLTRSDPDISPEHVLSFLKLTDKNNATVKDILAKITSFWDGEFEHGKKHFDAVEKAEHLGSVSLLLETLLLVPVEKLKSEVERDMVEIRNDTVRERLAIVRKMVDEVLSGQEPDDPLIAKEFDEDDRRRIDVLIRHVEDYRDAYRREVEKHGHEIARAGLGGTGHDGVALPSTPSLSIEVEAPVLRALLTMNDFQDPRLLILKTAKRVDQYRDASVRNEIIESLYSDHRIFSYNRKTFIGFGKLYAYVEKHREDKTLDKNDRAHFVEELVQFVSDFGADTEDAIVQEKCAFLGIPTNTPNYKYELQRFMKSLDAWKMGRGTSLGGGGGGGGGGGSHAVPATHSTAAGGQIQDQAERPAQASRKSSVSSGSSAGSGRRPRDAKPDHKRSSGMISRPEEEKRNRKPRASESRESDENEGEYRRNLVTEEWARANRAILREIEKRKPKLTEKIVGMIGSLRSRHQLEDWNKLYLGHGIERTLSRDAGMQDKIRREADDKRKENLLILIRGMNIFGSSIYETIRSDKELKRLVGFDRARVVRAFEEKMREVKD